VRLAEGGSVTSMAAMAIGFMAPLLSAKVFEEEDDDEEEKGAEPVAVA
jgi:hypothetical protein